MIILIMKRLLLVSCLGGFLLFSSGCASVAEGITRAFRGSDSPVEVKHRFCELHSPAFKGIAQRFDSHQTVEKDGNRKDVHKLLMVHGIGGYKAGYSARFQNNLIASLGFTRVSVAVKKIELRSSDYPGKKMGTLQVSRFQNETQDKELQFFELSWSVITEPEKAFLTASDTSLYSAHRTALNQELKTFVNNHVVDPALYAGTKKKIIIESASQAVCWMLHNDWEDLPAKSTSACHLDNIEDMFNLLGEKAEHNFSFVTHSLGSRIIVDMLDREVARVYKAKKRERSERIERLHKLIKNFEFHIYMMSNQLPLLQLGRPAAMITGQYDDYCVPGGAKYEERFLNNLFILAFSDPNDLLSYNIPASFADDYMDSRLCPIVVNVSVSVTESINLFGISEFANPLSAHLEYENDTRVVGLMTYGIGQKVTHPDVEKSCKWLKAIKD